MLRNLFNAPERRLIVAGAIVLAVYNGLLVMFPAPFGNWGQFRHIVPADLIRGSRFLLLIAGITLLLAVPGLLRSQRSAWLLALGAGLVSVLAYPLKNLNLWGLAGSIVFVGLLLGARPEFSIRNDDPPRLLSGAVTIVLGLGLIFVYTVAGLYFLDPEFRHSMTLSLAVKDGLRLMFLVPAIESEPATRHASGFLASVRIAILFVWVLGVVQLAQPVLYRRRGRRAQPGSVS